MAKFTNSNFGHQLLIALTLNNLSGKKYESPCVLPILKRKRYTSFKNKPKRIYSRIYDLYEPNSGKNHGTPPR